MVNARSARELLLAERTPSSSMVGEAFERAYSLPSIVTLLLLPTIVTVILWIQRANEVTVPQLFASFLLLCIPWWSYCGWQSSGQTLLPLFSFIASMYWLYFTVPLFWGDRFSPSISIYARYLSNWSITQALYLVLLGVICLWLGMRSRIGCWLAPTITLNLSQGEAAHNYLRSLLFIGTLLAYFINPFQFGAVFVQTLAVFQFTLPFVAFSILFRLYLRGNAKHIDKALLLFTVLVYLIVGLSSGWVGGTLLLLAAVCIMTIMIEKRKVPMWVLLAATFYVAFFQAGKAEYRAAYWYGDAGQDASVVQMLTDRVRGSFEQWQDLLSNPSGDGVAQFLRESVIMRTSLLQPTANVLELTPSKIPHQGGRLYSYLAVTWIPRLLWPEKPSANVANQYYQVTYDITAPDRLATVNVSIGTMVEGYISFGWLGVAATMFLLGIMIDFIQETFLSKQSGLLLAAIGVILAFRFTQIEAQLGSLLGTLVQQVLLILLIMLPICRRERRLGRDTERS